MTEDDIRSVLRDMREDPVPPDSLARVRMAVNERLAAKSRMPWFAAVIAAATLAVFFLMLRPRTASVPTVATRSAPVVAREAKRGTGHPIGTKSPRCEENQTAADCEAPDDPLVVRIETEDPDVVILLLGD